MELVYLWVENYKNIYQQGFNFSGRYRCEYDSEKNELTIDENKDYIHIFPDNINVTAIVGKNGSGKSSLFEKLYSSFGQQLSIIFTNNQFKINTFLKNITILNNTTNDYSIDDKRFPQVHFSWDILHYEPVVDFYTYFKTNPNILSNMLGIFSHPEYIDLSSYKNNSVIKYIEIFSKNEINIFSFSPNKVKIRLDIGKDQNEWNFENIKEKIEKLKFSKEEAEIKKEKYFRTIKRYVEKYLGDNSNEKTFTLEEYHLLQNELEDIKEILSRFPSFTLDIYDNDISFFSLSYGERSILLSNALIFESVLRKDNDGILICLDEPDLSLHPEWQKKYMHEIVNMFSKVSKNFHFLITSHSPFILSDIPKENVIFLEDGKQVVVNIDTFGANIHTLLSHGFFMSDGLMGEFAKEKINSVINYLKDPQSTIHTKEEAKKIVEIIGEPFLRNKLLEMYDDRFPPTKEEKIARLQKQIDELNK